MQPTITISIVCSAEQLAEVQARASALQADLYRLRVAFSVSTHRDPPPRPSMTLEEAQRDPQAFLAASPRPSGRCSSIPSWRAASGSCSRGKMAEQMCPGFRRYHFVGRSIDLPENLTDAQLDGRACVRCGHEPQIGESMRPVEAWSEQSAQLFECVDVEGCAVRVRVGDH